MNSCCTLPTAEQPVRLAEFDDLFASSLLRQERAGASVLRWWFAANAEETARDLTRRESECCSFFVFGLQGTENGLEITVEVPPSQKTVLDALERRAAERMSP